MCTLDEEIAGIFAKLQLELSRDILPRKQFLEEKFSADPLLRRLLMLNKEAKKLGLVGTNYLPTERKSVSEFNLDHFLLSQGIVPSRQNEEFMKNASLI